MKSKRKIWLGVGAFVVAGTGAMGARAADVPLADVRRPSALLPAVAAGFVSDTAIARVPSGSFVLAQHLAQRLAQHGDHGQPAGNEPAKTPSEGGEGGETKGLDDLPPDLAFAVRIALLRGHLMIGDQLVKQGQWNAALPHFLHPAEEIYGDIKNALTERNVAPFEAQLQTLVGLVKTRRGGNDYARALKSIGDATAAADASLQASVADRWASFVAEAAVEAIKTAAGEYENAIVGGRIAKPVEYQDARGFILEAERMIESVAAGLERKDASALKEIRARLVELKKVFPAAMPPRMPIKNHGAMLALVARIELAASRLM
jgi:hypothetical protein